MSFDSLDMVDILFLATCGYIFVCGLIGKGKVFDNATIHPTRYQDYFKAIRIFSIAGGAIGVASVVVGRFSQVFGMVLAALFFVAIVVLVIIIWPMNKDRVNRAGNKAKRHRKD